QLERREQARRLRGAEAAGGDELAGRAAGQLPQARREQVVGHVDGGGAAGTAADQQRQQLAVGEGLRPAAQQALARAVLLRQVEDAARRAGGGEGLAHRSASTSAGTSSAALPRRETSASGVSGVGSGLTSTTNAPAPFANCGIAAAGYTSDEVPTTS